MNLPTNCEWEVGYEVCFYREYFHHFREDSIKDNKEYPQKRTFDLCLFSENDIVIIEAKVQQSFESKQIRDFHSDEQLIKDLLNKDIKVQTLLLASSKYYQNYEKYGDIDILQDFKLRISWMDIYGLYPDKLYLQADKVYNN